MIQSQTYQQILHRNDAAVISSRRRPAWLLNAYKRAREHPRRRGMMVKMEKRERCFPAHSSTLNVVSAARVHSCRNIYHSVSSRVALEHATIRGVRDILQVIRQRSIIHDTIHRHRYPGNARESAYHHQGHAIDRALFHCRVARNLGIRS